tara:strand:+ start:89075 stop:90352 length:1278 start_codon:yes stop_codon:yes gene_type:complete
MLAGVSLSAETTNRDRDLRNLNSAEGAFQSGFPTEAEHYLERIPPDSPVQKEIQLRELRTFLAFHRGDLTGARDYLRALFKDKANGQSAGPFRLYLAEELFLLRQFRSFGILESAMPQKTGWVEFRNKLDSSQYPLLICQFVSEENGVATPAGSPLDKHLQFSNPLEFANLRNRTLNQGDRLQLQLMTTIYHGYSVVGQDLKSRPDQVPWLSDHLRLCQESLSSQDRSVMNAKQKEWLQEYLYRLQFARWALDGSARASFEFGDFLFRSGAGNPDAYESLHLFRRALDQSLEKELFQGDSHTDSESQGLGLHGVSSILRKMEQLYARLERPEDRRTVSALAAALETYAFSDQDQNSLQALRRSILDICGENRLNRESLVFRILLSGQKDAKGLKRDLLKRDTELDGQELLSLMIFRYGFLANGLR